MKHMARAAFAVIVACAATIVAIGPAQAAETGYEGPVYGTSTTALTGQKPQSDNVEVTS